MITHYQRIRYSVLILAKMLLGFYSLFLLTSCSINPATGEANFVTMSEAREKEIGAEEHQKVIDSMPLYEDEKLLAYVVKVGNKVAKAGDRPDLEYTYTIIDSPEINAFALPGGYVYVNRGLLTYTNSEAELAAVLGHEIAHITARHAVQQNARTGLANVASTVGGFVAAVATGSGFIGSQISQISSIWAQAGLSGYGREAELEADTLGAEYLYDAGYDPEAMIGVITALKNQEDFKRRVTGQGGGYHGLFATHPRNDTRLQQAIANVGQLDTSNVTEIDEKEFRTAVEGLVVGESQSSQTRDDRNRYYQQLLGYTMVFPDEWQVAETPTTVKAEGESGNSIFVEVQRLQANVEPRAYIQEQLGITNLQKSEPLSQFRLLGHTGVLQTGNDELERIAVIYMGPRAFIFRGKAKGESLEELDADLLASIRTFRAIQRNEQLPGNELRIRFVQASEFFDFAIVAQTSKLAYPEESLRLLNGYYPSGSPQPGDWIKLVD